MWFRSAAALALVGALAGISSAQRHVFSRALPPDRAALNRLNLKLEWSLYLPVQGRRDSIESVQTFDDQIFVQTRTGLLVAIDAVTGKVQWSASLGNGGYANVYPVAVNSQFVFAAHVTRVYAFYRYRGVVEFVTDLRTPPTAGLTADETHLYATLTTRPGSAGVERIAAYELPHPIVLPDPNKIDALKPTDKFDRLKNPVDELTKRYPVVGVLRPAPSTKMDDIGRSSNLRDMPIGGMSGSRTPSLAVLTRITPPYKREGAAPVVSLVVMPSLRQPYHLRDESSRAVQQTPSISTIPPSVASALALADLRPKGIEPPLKWEYGMSEGVAFRLTLTPHRLWAVTESRGFVALAKLDKKMEIAGRTFEQIMAAPAQAGTLAYVPLGDGSVIAVDLEAGNNEGGIITLWKANVGGLMNRTPIVTDDAIFAAGANSGVARIERKSGDVAWRTDRLSDRVVGVNKDFLYVQNRQGKLQVFDVKKANGGPGRALPLSSIDMSRFNVPIVNTVSDRIYFAGDNGLLVCLRDASAKYQTPIRMAPKITVNETPKTGVVGLNKDGGAKKADAPKQE